MNAYKLKLLKAFSGSYFNIAGSRTWTAATTSKITLSLVWHVNKLNRLKRSIKTHSQINLYSQVLAAMTIQFEWVNHNLNCCFIQANLMLLLLLLNYDVIGDEYLNLILDEWKRRRKRSMLSNVKRHSNDHEQLCRWFSSISLSNSSLYYCETKSSCVQLVNPNLKNNNFYCYSQQIYQTNYHVVDSF